MMTESDAKDEELGAYNSNNMKKARLNSTLAALLDDPVLADVPKKPTLSDVDTLISVELGSAMRISILKLDGTSFGTCLTHHQLYSFHIHILTNILNALYECSELQAGPDLLVSWFR